MRLPWTTPISQQQLYWSLFVGVVIASDLVFAAALSASHSVNVSTYHLDGAFQTASGLYRLAQGQWPGDDFLPYLGLGPLYLLYPLFHLAGGDLAASQFSAWFFTLVAGAWCSGLVAGLLARRHRFIWGCMVATGFLVAAWLLASSRIANLLLMDPGHSLRPLRALAPFLFLPGAYLLFRACRTRTACIATGVLAGIAPLWSNDYGIPTACLLLLWIAMRCVNDPRGISFFLISILSGSVSFVSLGMLATHGALGELLSYWYVDVRNDQWWYFGPWSQDSRIYGAVDLIKVLVIDSLGAIFVLASVAIFYLRNKSESNALLLFLGLAMCGGGLLSTMGGHRDFGYFSGLLRWSLVVILFGGAYLGVLAVQSRFTRYVGSLSVRLPQLGIMIGAGFSGIVVLLAIGQLVLAAQSRTAAQSDPHRIFVPELGGFVSREYETHIQTARASSGSAVEEYWGLWSAVNRHHTNVRVDSVIHALGRERTNFQTLIETLPDAVVTTSRSFSRATELFQPWSFSANWWFYRPLLQMYQPVVTSPSTMVWQKRMTYAQWPEMVCTFSGAVFELGDTAYPSYFDVELAIDISSTLNARALVLVKNNINQAFKAGGYLSVNRHANSIRFPVRVESASDRFDVLTIPNSESALGLKISTCRAFKIGYVPDAVLPIAERKGEVPRGS